MTFQRVFDVLAAIVTVALVAVVVSAPNTAAVINAFGNAFATSIGAAVSPVTGRKPQ